MVLIQLEIFRKVEIFSGIEKLIPLNSKGLQAFNW